MIRESGRALLAILNDVLDLSKVEDGAAAVQAFGAAAFDLVLMDIQMPVMNGVEATEVIRRLEAETGRPRTPLLALSANVMKRWRAPATRRPDAGLRTVAAGAIMAAG